MGDRRAFRGWRFGRWAHFPVERQHAKGTGLSQDQLFRVRRGHPVGSSQRRNYRALDLLAQRQTLQRRAGAGQHGPHRRRSAHRGVQSSTSSHVEHQSHENSCSSEEPDNNLGLSWKRFQCQDQEESQCRGSLQFTNEMRWLQVLLNSLKLFFITIYCCFILVC